MTNKTINLDLAYVDRHTVKIHAAYTSFGQPREDVITVVHGSDYVYTDDIAAGKIVLDEYGFGYYRQTHGDVRRPCNREIAVNWSSEEAVKCAEREIEKWITISENGILEEGRKHPAWEQMQRRVEDVLVGFKEDFYHHDTLALGRFPVSPFVWEIRPAGSNLYMLYDTLAEIAIEGYTNQHEYWKWDGKRFVLLLNFPAVAEAINRLPKPKGED